MKRAAAIAFFVVLLASCRDNDSPTNFGGTYQYIARDSVGTIHESGVLNLTSNGHMAEGELLLSDQEQILLAGMITSGTIHLERSVGCHNCFYTIDGTLDVDGILGTWSRGRLIVEAKGTFTARRF
ncbi:MAG: hypothetical protein HY961_08840 [Ignavibacteriae bacterium]|nr:hypothetical protein [Ignavibacteriota bacterium]